MNADIAVNDLLVVFCGCVVVVLPVVGLWVLGRLVGGVRK